MLTKIKKFSLTSIMILSCQTNIFAMFVPQKTTEEYFEEYNDKFNKYGRPQYKIFIILQKLFEKDQQIIKNELIKKTRLLKEKDNNKEFILDKEIYEIKKLWDKFKSFYNYDFLDLIMYPLDKPANNQNLEEMKKERTKKPLNILTHPDKYITPENNEKMDELYRYLEDTSRPTKSMDFTIRPIMLIALATPETLAFHTQMKIVATVCSLPSLLFPNYFKSKKIFNKEQKTNAVNIQIKQHLDSVKQYNNATKHFNNEIKKCDNEIKNYDNAIRVRTFSISIKQQHAREALNIFSTKNKDLNN